MSADIPSPERTGEIKPHAETLARFLPAANRTVTILLCTFNGERFLSQQLDSLERQTFKNWKLMASDDGSSDQTKSILHAFRKSFEPGKVQVVDGPGAGRQRIFCFWLAERILSA